MPCNTFLQIYLGNFLIKSYFKPLKTFFSTFAYWQALEKAHIQRKPLKKFHQIQNFTTYYWFQSNYHDIKICTFILNIRIFLVKPYCSKRSCKLFYVSSTSNKLIIMCFGIQFSPKKFITNLKTSLAHSNIHKSKLVIVETNFTKTNKPCLFCLFNHVQ